MLWLVMVIYVGASMASVISHKEEEGLDLEGHEARIRSIPKTILPVEEEVTLLHQAGQFGLGRFLLSSQGLNGYWTSYMICKAPHLSLENPLENWVIHHCPAVRATQERFRIFQRELQNSLRANQKIVSIPCGLMDDLLSLNYDDLENVEIVGIDLDPESLTHAQQNAQDHKKKASFLKKNAWDLQAHEEYDLITSNGLNIYESNDEKVVALYKEFYKALRSKGKLITSFLTPSPALSSESSWKDVNPREALKQKALFVDILQARFQFFRTEAQTRTQLEKAGFQNIEFIYDSKGMFPTVIAEKL